MENDKYFKLFSNCIPVKGARRSVICDLQRGGFSFIPNDLYEILTECKGLSAKEIKLKYGNENDIQINEYFDFLISNEIGFWCRKEDLDLFPDIELKWEVPALITNVIIDVDITSVHNYQKIFSELEDIGCQNVQIRFYSFRTVPELKSILNLLEFSRIKSMELLIKYDKQISANEIRSLSKDYRRIKTIFVHSADEHKLDKARAANGMGNIMYVTDCIDSNSHCGIIDPLYFTEGIHSFAEARKYNSCLNRKVAIDVNGDIKNCPSMKNTYGNSHTHTIKEAINMNGYKDTWSITKDQIDVCKDCEFRYICTDCRAFIQNPKNILSKPSKCDYNPYTAQWNSLS